MRYLSLFLLLIVTSAFPQKFEYSAVIGKFQQASSFYLNPAGFLLVTDAGSSEIYKLDTLGAVKKQNGGYGWKEGSFDDPVDIYSNTLNVFVTDKNNHRVQMFDKDLNYISSLTSPKNSNKSSGYNNSGNYNGSGNDISFGYPLSCVVSSQGDLFVLDSENKRVLRYDLFGNFIMEFGNYQWGNYALSKPVQMAVDQGSNIYVIDGSRIVIYDRFGNGAGTIKQDTGFTSIRIIFNNLVLTSNNKIYYVDLSKPEFEVKPLPLPGIEEGTEIVSSLIFNGKLYVLTPKQIMIFNPVEG